jgi:response regulator of citrate/malate metabolism
MMKPRILILERDCIVAMDIKNIIINNGFTCCGVAVTLPQYKSFLQNKEYDLLISETMLNNIQIGKVLSYHNHEKPVLFLSGASKKSITSQLDNNFSNFSYLKKPFKEEDLISHLNKLLVNI